MPKNDRTGVKDNTYTRAADAPEKLKAYVALGVTVSCRDGQEEATGECPFCGKGDKFYLNVETGQCHCKHAGCVGSKGYNVSTFVAAFHDACFQATKDEDYKSLAVEKGLLHPAMLADWGVCKNYLNDQWLAPGYILEGEHRGSVRQLYRYVRDAQGRKRFIPTPGLGHHLLGYGCFDERKKDLYVCEGLFDGAALRETLRYTRRAKIDSKTCYKVTADEELCMLANANVVAVPNASTFHPSWASCMEGKNVFLLYDNDHPSKNERNGDYIEPAGYAGMRRAATVILGTSTRTEKLRFLKWSKDDEHIGYDPKLPDRFDVRDMLSQARTVQQRSAKVGSLIAKTTDIPPEWLPSLAQNEQNQIRTIPCQSWNELVVVWKKAMEWSVGHDIGLSVMMAAAASTPVVGEQLWVRMMSPPSTGKTWFAEALATARKHVVAKSTIRGFASGRSGGEGDGDTSLLKEILGKTFILKDGDTLLKSPTKDQILAEARDIYDGCFRTHYRSGNNRNYENIRMTWILCGTASLHALDTSELGERFLSCVIMKKADEKFEKSINSRVFWRMARNVRTRVNGVPESQYDPAQLLAYQMTGGYLEWLWENAGPLVDRVSENLTEDQCEYVDNLAQFVAHVRARPSKSQDDTTDRELSARLTAQLARLMLFLTVVLGKDRADDEVMGRVRKVAIDTAEGKTLTFCKYLVKAGEGGMDSRSLSKATPYTDTQVRDYMRFLRSIEVVETFQPGQGASLRYRLTKRMERLYRLVMEGRQ